MSIANQIHQTYEKGQGIFRMVPTWVARTFNQPGQRLRLHPDDIFALGMKRGAIKERWFSSVVPASMDANVPWDEGLSYISISDDPSEKILFKDVIAELGVAMIGRELMEKFGTWPMYSKFFDYKLALFHHLHLNDVAAKRVDRLGKPEAYYFPPQLNHYTGEFPVTYFGFDPNVTKEMVRQRLLEYDQRDTRLTELSRGYRLTPGTGWFVPAGVVHAPGSLLTYEPQWNSDVASIFENVTTGEVNAREYLVNDVPEAHKNDVDYLISLMDWEKNTDPYFREHYFRPPILISPTNEGFTEKWVIYGNPYFSAKELSIAPRASVRVIDGAAYGCILVQGHGYFGGIDAEAAIQLRYGQLSADEFFVSEPAAKAGVMITNQSYIEPMVFLKHFGPNHPESPKE